MLTYLILALLFLVLTMIVVASRFDLTERLRRRWEAELQTPEAREAAVQARSMAASEIRAYIIGAAMIAVGKLIWRWRSAPEGSPQKLVWNTVVLAAAAFGVWLLISLIDSLINRAPRPLPDYGQIQEEQWESQDPAEPDWRNI